MNARDRTSAAVSLPPLRELGLSGRRSMGSVEGADMSEPSSASTPQDHPRARHPQLWQRPSASAHVQQSQQSAPAYQPVFHQQLTPPLSAGHDFNHRSMEYAPKHDRPSYVTPGPPHSTQLTPVSGSGNIGPGVRGDDTPHLQQPRRREPKPTRNTRQPHQTSYSHAHPSATYGSLQPAPTSPVYQAQHSMPPPVSQRNHTSPIQEQIPPQPSPVTPTHPPYPYYPPQPRPTTVGPQHSTQHQAPTNPYPSPAPPASVPPAQDTWEQVPHRSQHQLQRQYSQSQQHHQHQQQPISHSQPSHNPQPHTPQPSHHPSQPHHTVGHPNGHPPHLSRAQAHSQAHHYPSPVQPRQPLQQHPSVQQPPSHSGSHSHAHSPPTPQSALPPTSHPTSHPPPTPQPVYPASYTHYPPHHASQTPIVQFSHPPPPPPSVQPPSTLAGAQQVQHQPELSRSQISPRTPQQSQPPQHISSHHQPPPAAPQPRSYQPERPVEPAYSSYSQFHPQPQPPQHVAQHQPQHQPQHSPAHSSQNIYQHPPPQPPHPHQYSPQHAQSHSHQQVAPPPHQAPQALHYQRATNASGPPSGPPSHPQPPPPHPSQPSHPSFPHQPSHPSHTPEPIHQPPPPHQPHAQQHVQQLHQLPAAVPAPAATPATPLTQQQHHPPIQYQHQTEGQHPQSVTSLPPPAAPPTGQAPLSTAPFGRSTTLAPVDNRTVTFAVTDPEEISTRDGTMAEIMKHCRILYDFAARYANLNASLPHTQPSPQECTDMAWRAKEVVRLLEHLRRMSMPEAERIKMDNISANSAAAAAADDHRPPKRPWEDMVQGGQEDSSFSEFPAAGEKEQSTAEKDMEIIRTKRATSTAGGNANAGQPKSKYRKRSRATPPGKCHSCNIRETPEWRRGPDGARTLCNACGLHYAKLMRKREKQLGNNPDAPRIDMETLRASARAADIGGEKHSSRSAKQSNEASDSGEHDKHQGTQSQGHHQGSFQVMQVTTPTEISTRLQSDHVQAQHSLPTPASANSRPPPPPWVTNTTPRGGFQLQEIDHQSFMRTSDHGSSNHTSPR